MAATQRMIVSIPLIFKWKFYDYHRTNKHVVIIDAQSDDWRFSATVTLIASDPNKLVLKIRDLKDAALQWEGSARTPNEQGPSKARAIESED